MTPSEIKKDSKEKQKNIEDSNSKKGFLGRFRTFMFKEDTNSSVDLNEGQPKTVPTPSQTTQQAQNPQSLQNPQKDNSNQENEAPTKSIKLFSRKQKSHSNHKNKPKNKAEEKKPENISFGKGINLVVTKTTEEIKVEVKKTKVNLSGLLTILIFVFITILIFGVNIVFKLGYNRQVESNEVLKTQISNKQFIAEANAQMVDRLFLMQQLDEKNFSPKDVFTFSNEQFANYGDVRMIEVTNDLRFALTGTADSYDAAADLWHQLSTSSSINTLEISSVSESEDGTVNVNFEGVLNYDKFFRLVEN